MSFSINTNITSLQAQNYLRQTSNFQSATINEVTSGLRIVNSGDDAAGLAIANTYRSNEAVLTQGISNANDGLSQLQIADGGISNISQLLDRARTLATQSASGAFKGDRGVLNSEFQSVLTEINRQAQAIGLNQGGEFAKNLSVFIGGGQASGTISATTNGSVGLNLTNATVDSQSLGLNGVQAVNASGRDLSAGQATSVQNIVQAPANAQPNNTTTFDFAGSGFSDANKVAVSVNLTGVTDVNTLATAVNAAIQNAGNGTTAASTAFKNAGISASVYTDSNGGQHLAFNSGNAAFQVQAGDVLANALLGNTQAATGATAADGVALATTVTGSANTTAGTTAGQSTIQIQGGGLTSPVDLVVASGTNVAGLQTLVNNNATLQAAGISLTTATSGSPLVFTSATGQNFSVEAAGDTANVFGLGTFQYGAGSTVANTSFTGATAYDPTTAYGNTNLEFSVNGSATSGHVVTVNLSAGDATSGSVVGNTDLSGGVTITTANEQLSVTVDGGSAQTITLAAADTTGAKLVTDINSQLTGAVASLAVSGSHTYLEITSDSKGANSSVAVANGNHTALADTIGVAGTTAGQSRSLSSLEQGINQAIAGDSTLSAAGLTASASGSDLVLSSNNGTNFQLNSYSAHGNVGFGTAGAAFGGGNVAEASAFTAEESGGAYQTSAFGFTGISHGDDTQSITLTANDAAGTPQALTVQLENNGTTQNAATADEAIATINAALQSSNVAALQGIVAVKDQNGSSDQIKFISTAAFNVSIGSDANGTGIQSQGNNYAAGVVGTGSTADISNVTTATAAVNALGTAVTKLGDSQAAIGRGENQFNYAINLASSQLTNFAAAESQIRDANLATESANLTKSSIQLQAGIAALAQANSAPQQILSLLKG